MNAKTRKANTARLALEALEVREVPAVNILVDYSYDLRSNGGSGFFEDRPDARATLNRVALEAGQRLDANLSAVTPGNGNTWTATFFNPANGQQATLANVNLPANTLIVYAGARAMPGTEAGQGGYGGYGWSGTLAWGKTVERRNSAGFATWGGSISFDSTENWHLGQTADGLDGNELDFYSVATHEFGHLLGVGTAPEWFSKVQGNSFLGANAVSVFGGPVPLQPGGSHWADGLTVNGQRISLDPVLNFGTRVTWTSLDQAALRDLGWGAGAAAATSPPVSLPAPTPVVPPTSLPKPVTPPGNSSGSPVLVSGPNGRVDVFTRGGDGNLSGTGRSFTPFAGFTGTVRTAVADFNGDQIPDYAFAAGAGISARVRIVDGANGNRIVGATTVLGGFAGGVFVAAGDTNKDGRAELVVSTDRGGSPLVEVYRVAGDRLARVTGFVPFSPVNPNGVRVAMGDVNKDGAADLILGTGPGQVGRVMLYDGAALGTGSTVTMRSAFLAFDPSATSGVNVASGDVNGDGFADVIVSQDAGGTSLVRIWSGATVSANPGTAVSALPPVNEFFANGTADRNGIRVVARDIDSDGKADLVTSLSAGTGQWLRVLSLSGTAVKTQNAIFPFGTSAVRAGVQAGMHTATAPEAQGFLPTGGPCLCCRPALNTPLCGRVSN